MPGDEFYNIAEIQSMSPSEFAEAKERGFKRPALVAQPVTEQDVAAARELPEHLTGRPAAAGINLGSSAPLTEWQPPKLIEPSQNVWAAKKSGSDFTCPSGQKCRLRPLSLEALMMEGILDQVTRLEGLAQALINNAEGLPPEKLALPSRDDFAKLLKLVNVIVPMAVADPRIYKDDETIPEGGITVSDIDLEDRVAILNEALKGLKALDNFRPVG